VIILDTNVLIEVFKGNKEVIKQLLMPDLTTFP